MFSLTAKLRGADWFSLVSCTASERHVHTFLERQVRAREFSPKEAPEMSNREHPFACRMQIADEE